MTPAAIRRRIADICAAVQLPAKLDGARVLLSHYPDAETLHFLRPGEDLATVHAINAAFAAEIQRRGGNPVMVPLSLSAYYDFLAAHPTLRDSPATRAQFIHHATHATRA